MSLKSMVSILHLALVGCMALPSVSQAGTGTCFLKTLPTTGSTALNAAAATYGFTAVGVSTGANAANVPVGNVVRNGTFQILGGTGSVSTVGHDPTIQAIAVLTYSQLDVNGAHPPVQQYFGIDINMYTCLTTLTYYGMSNNNLSSEKYSAVIVNGGDGLRLMSNNTNLYLAFGAAQRL